jgi:MFS family permease
MVGLARGRVHYAWIVFGVTFFTLLAAAGIRSTPGVLIVPLEQEFGWSRAAISLAVGINLLLFGLCGPFAAALMARFGVRRVLVCSLLLIATGVGLTTVMRAPWQMDVLWGVVVGIGTGSMAGVLAATVANRWFLARRGLVTGILTAATATGQLVFLPVLASLAVGQGWRWATATVALATLAAVPVVALVMRDDPARVGLRPYGAPEGYVAPERIGNPFAAAVSGLRAGLRSVDFWLLAGSFFICGATTNGLIGTHLIPASIDHGIPEVTAASMLALIGVFDVIGTTASGWLTDRMDSRWLLFWYYGLRGLSLLLLPFALSSTYLVLLLFIVFYGLDWVATVPPTIALSSEKFGRERGAIVFGWIFAAHQFGASFAAFTAGALRTWLGDYQVTFITAGLLCLVASGLVIRIGRGARGRSRALPLAPEAA